MLTRALLVIDIDHSNEWPDRLEDVNFEDKRSVGLAIKSRVEEERGHNGIIISVIYGYQGAVPLVQDRFTDDPEVCIACQDRPFRLSRFLNHEHSRGWKEAAFIKLENNAFSNQELPAYLRFHGITEVELAGCYTDICVMETAIGAVTHGFSVTMLEQCVYRRFQNERGKKDWLDIVKRSALWNPKLFVQIK